MAGADSMIDIAVSVKGIPNADNGFLMVFSADPFPDADFSLDWVQEENTGNVYKGRFKSQEIEAWLCPALNLSEGGAGKCSASSRWLPGQAGVIGWSGSHFRVSRVASLMLHQARPQDFSSCLTPIAVGITVHALLVQFEGATLDGLPV